MWVSLCVCVFCACVVMVCVDVGTCIHNYVYVHVYVVCAVCFMMCVCVWVGCVCFCMCTYMYMYVHVHASGRVILPNLKSHWTMRCAFLSANMHVHVHANCVWMAHVNTGGAVCATLSNIIMWLTCDTLRLMTEYVHVRTLYSKLYWCELKDFWNALYAVLWRWLYLWNVQKFSPYPLPPMYIHVLVKLCRNLYLFSLLIYPLLFSLPFSSSPLSPSPFTC